MFLVKLEADLKLLISCFFKMSSHEMLLKFMDCEDMGSPTARTPFQHYGQNCSFGFPIQCYLERYWHTECFRFPSQVEHYVIGKVSQPTEFLTLSCLIGSIQ